MKRKKLWKLVTGQTLHCSNSRAIDYVSTVLTDTSLLSIVSAFYNPGLVRILTSKATWLHDRAFLVKIHRRALSIRQAACEHDWSEVVEFASKLEIAFATGRLSAWPWELATIGSPLRYYVRAVSGA